jgi:hypothetical protein
VAFPASALLDMPAAAAMSSITCNRIDLSILG